MKVFQPMVEYWTVLLYIVIVLSITIANLFAIRQSDLQTRVATQHRLADQATPRAAAPMVATAWLGAEGGYAAASKEITDYLRNVSCYCLIENK